MGIAQNGVVSGTIKSGNKPMPFTNVILKGTPYGCISDEKGAYEIKNVPLGNYMLEASYTGFKTNSQEIILKAGSPHLTIPIHLTALYYNLDQMVVTGTRTHKRKTESAIIVGVIDSKTIDNVQACSMSEGLRFQPGIRVETDCQTCNYTQLRMNGLGGGYSQILINGRPTFSPLTGLYGLEQIPYNMIDRIEVVRGGGSALYGSSAIGGTVNLITKIPRSNHYQLNFTQQLINGTTSDRLINGNTTVVNQKNNAGLNVFIAARERAPYDHNGDNLSELPALTNNSFGINTFFKPTENQKIELNLSHINEYRYGGEIGANPAHIASQSEERTHKILMTNVDYQINFNQNKSSIISYFAFQQTLRKHYTGIFPDDSISTLQHLSIPPYGVSDNTTQQFGVQLNHRLNHFISGANTLTLGMENVKDKVWDEIKTYHYTIDQSTNNSGIFLQSDWNVLTKTNLLLGIRMDKHNFLDQWVYNPRVALLHTTKQKIQLRVNWGKGFRAPQAFDSDMHIAFAGGGVSRITLNPNLKQETSHSYSASINYDKPNEKWIAGFTIDGFYTQLKNAFNLEENGFDSHGLRFIKGNGDGAIVKGITLEIRAKYKNKAQLEAGYTLQSSHYENPVYNAEGLEPTKVFLRTPNNYAYALLNLSPWKRLSGNVNYVYTGTMEIIHFSGAPEQTTNAYKTTHAFHEFSFKVNYALELSTISTTINFYGGIKNLTNAYQTDFDSGKNRDSNYIYGPALPKTYFIGIGISPS